MKPELESGGLSSAFCREGRVSWARNVVCAVMTSPLQMRKSAVARVPSCAVASFPVHSVQVVWKRKMTPLRCAKRGEGLGDFRHATAHVPRAELGLDVGDDVECRRRVVGRRAVVGGEAEEDLLEVWIANAAIDLGGEGTAGCDFGQVAQFAEIARGERAPKFGGRAVEVGLAGKLVDAARVLEEFRDLGLLPERGVLVNHGAVRPKIAAGGIEADEVEVIFHALACGGKKFAQDVRHGEQRRSGAPTKTIDAQLLQLAAGLAVAFPHLHRLARARQADGGGESTESGADDEDFAWHSLLAKACYIGDRRKICKES